MSGEAKEKRRYWTKAQKEAILREYKRGGVSLAVLSRRFQVHPVTLYKWRRQMTQQKALGDGSLSCGELMKALEETQRENERLKKAVGELVVEKQILRAANEILKKRQRQALLPLRRRSCGRGRLGK